MCATKTVWTSPVKITSVLGKMGKMLTIAASRGYFEERAGAGRAHSAAPGHGTFLINFSGHYCLFSLVTHLPSHSPPSCPHFVRNIYLAPARIQGHGRSLETQRTSALAPALGSPWRPIQEKTVTECGEVKCLRQAWAGRVCLPRGDSREPS